MIHEYNLALIIAAVLDAFAAALHIGVVIVGPRWYRLFGAGERFARAAEAGSMYPAAVTFVIAMVLFAWAIYALSGATVIGPLPFLRPVLAATTLVYLLRGIAGPFLLVGTGHSRQFVIISSAICLVFGVAHLLGLAQMWGRLA